MVRYKLDTIRSEIQTRSIYPQSHSVRSMMSGTRPVRSIGMWPSEICVDWLVVVETGVCVEQSRGLYCEIGLIITMIHAHEQTHNTSFQCSLHRSIHEGDYKNIISHIRGCIDFSHLVCRSASSSWDVLSLLFLSWRLRSSYFLCRVQCESIVDMTMVTLTWT